MSILYFSDILSKVGLDAKKVKLIRHSLRDKCFKACYDAKKVFEYTCHQKENFSKNYDYWAVFISESGTYAKFFACYKVGGPVPDVVENAPEGLPEIEKNKYVGNFAYYDLEHVDLLREYENRLIIDWGNSTIMWHQKGTTEKEVVAIRGDCKISFSGFENLILTYEELKEIVENPDIYSDWHSALSSVNAIYLIVDCESGQQYIGSSYGKGGLLSRWSYYVSSLHGDNKMMKELICNYPERYNNFQFSILQIIPKTVTAEEAINLESLYKRKLLTIKFGMNDN